MEPAVSSADMEKRTGHGNRQGVRFYLKEEYITECTLYTNVKRLRTFDEAIKKVLKEKSTSNSDYQQRLQYYNVLACIEDEDGKVQETYGLHQAFKCSPLQGDFTAARIFNHFGYDVVNWGSRHCKNTMHYGTDFIASNGANVYSMLDGKIDSIDTRNHTVTVITTENIKFWYEDDKKHPVKITYGNIKAKSGLSEGDIVTAGERIGKVDTYKHCESFNPETSANFLHVSVKVKYNIAVWDWHDVDPQFLIYRENQ